ncbi:MAG: hypothetical protein PVG39_00370 [Desulfobacteraceae bacterium]
MKPIVFDKLNLLEYTDLCMAIRLNMSRFGQIRAHKIEDRSYKSRLLTQCYLNIIQKALDLGIDVEGF